jgi:hypothetical protein
MDKGIWGGVNGFSGLARGEVFVRVCCSGDEVEPVQDMKDAATEERNAADGATSRGQPVQVRRAADDGQQKAHDPHRPTANPQEQQGESPARCVALTEQGFQEGQDRHRLFASGCAAFDACGSRRVRAPA